MRLPIPTVVTLVLYLTRLATAGPLSPEEADAAAQLAIEDGYEVYDLFESDPTALDHDIHDFYDTFVTHDGALNTTFLDDLDDVDAFDDSDEPLGTKVVQKLKSKPLEDVLYAVVSKYIAEWSKSSKDFCINFLTSLSHSIRTVPLVGHEFPIPSHEVFRNLWTCGIGTAGHLSFVLAGFMIEREFATDPVQSPSSNLLESLQGPLNQEGPVVYLKHLNMFAHTPFVLSTEAGVSIKAAVVPSYAMRADKQLEQFKVSGDFKSVAGLAIWMEYQRTVSERGKRHFLAENAAAYWSSLVQYTPVLVGATKDGNGYVIVSSPTQAKFSDVLQSAIVATRSGPKSFNAIEKAKGLVSLAINKRAVEYPEFDETATYSTLDQAAEARRNLTLREAMIKADNFRGVVTKDSAGVTVSKENIGNLFSRYCDTYSDVKNGVVIESELRFGSVSSKINSECQSKSGAYLKSVNDGTVDLYTVKTIAPKTVAGKVKNAIKAGLKKVTGIN